VDTHTIAGAELGALLQVSLLEAFDDCAHQVTGVDAVSSI
jgi:hypothetical protein